MNPNTKKLLFRIAETPVKDKVRFSLFEHKTKNPYFEDWKSNPKFKHDINSLMNKNIKNIGIFGGFGLCIIDIDNLDNTELIEFCDDFLGETLTTKTGNGIHKIYFYNEEVPFSTIRLKKDGVEYGEYRNSQSHHTVEAGSIHPNGSEYTILNDTSIKEITSNDILSLNNYFDCNLKVEKSNSRSLLEDYTQNTKPKVIDFDDIKLKIKVEMSFDELKTLLNLETTDFTKNKTPFGEFLECKMEHPVHGSDHGNKNFIVKYWNTKRPYVSWQCFRHELDVPKEDVNLVRNSLTLWAMINGHIECDDTLDITNNKLIELKNLYQNGGIKK